jgi:hypothetical protein
MRLRPTMLEELTPGSVFSQAIMEEPPPRAILLVEGPDEDTILFDHLAQGVVRIIAGGKKAVLGAAQIALDTGMTNVLGLVDHDLDVLRGRDRYPSNVVSSDGYDLMSDVVAVLGDDVLRRVLNAHAAMSVRDIEATRGRKVAEVVFEVTTPLAALRLASLESGYPLVLRRYDFRQVLTPGFEAADVSVYVANAIFRREGFTIDETVIDDVRQRVPEVGHRRHAGGHDLVAASVALIAKAGGSRVSKDAIAANLMSLATCDVLAAVRCLQVLHTSAQDATGRGLFDCIAA